MRLPQMRSATLLLSSLFLFACGGTTGDQTDAGDTDAGDQTEAAVEAGPDVDNGSPSTTYPAFKIDAPQVESLGGNVLTTPKIVPVYFANDDTGFTPTVTSFLNKLPTSTYWGPGESEYGVGAISIATPVQLTEDGPVTIDDTAIQTWLSGKLAAQDPLWPAPDANTVYVLFYPSATTKITLQGEASCSAFGGYHSDVILPDKITDVAYAVIPRCSNFGGLKGLDAVSATASHEIVEAATDPYPMNQAAYSQLDDNHLIWEFILGGAEIGDMCAQTPSSFYAPADIGTTVQRVWSNAKAKAGHNPCQPDDGAPYFNSVPLLPEKVNILGQLTTEGVTIPVGQTKTIEVDLFSDAATSGDWTVSAIDSGTLQGQAAELGFEWDRTTGRNGEKLHLTITVKKASQYNAEAFLLQSSLGAQTNFWIGVVAN
ncbi:MAG TPA: hypothetical protein VGH28_21100 [Polyangiaceae bacterium]